MTGLGTVIRAGVSRRRVQTLVMTLTTTTAVTASLLGTGLIVSSREPFDHAFDRAHGAHLAARFSSSEIDPAALAATAQVAGVTAVAGPYPLVSLPPKAVDTDGGLPPDIRLPDMTIVARPPTNTGVDELTPNLAATTSCSLSNPASITASASASSWPSTRRALRTATRCASACWNESTRATTLMPHGTRLDGC